MLKQRGFFIPVIIIVLTLTYATPIMAQTPQGTFYSTNGHPPQQEMTNHQQRTHPVDPLCDLAWSSGRSSVAHIEAAFNAARAAESEQLGLDLPHLTLPAQAAWDVLSDAEKALWLINRERVDRNILPLTSLQTSVMTVAQTYADYLLAHDTFSHTADGLTPWQRLAAQADIQACQDPLPVSESLAAFWTSGTQVGLPIERAIYTWLYADGACCNWGHRHTILWRGYANNSGSAESEGFLGVGRASGAHQYGGLSWNHAELIVINLFDPCERWGQPPAEETAIEETVAPVVTAPPMRPTVVGQVTDEAGQGIGGVLLELTTSSQTITTTTQATGVYTFHNLLEGAYTLTLLKTGYTLTPTTFSLTVAAEGAPTPLMVRLQPTVSQTEPTPTYRVHLPLMRHGY